MGKEGERVMVPLTQGHYGGPGDTAANLLLASKIPLGFFWGEDVLVDEAGYIRARPELLYIDGAGYGSWSSTFDVAASNNTSCIFKSVNSGNTIYYSAGVTDDSLATLEYYSGGVWNAITGTGSAYTYPSENNVEYISALESIPAIAIVSTGSSTSQKMIYVTGTGAIAAALAEQTGLTGQDEDRLFCWYSGLIYFSARGDYTDGYDHLAAGTDTGEWFSLGPSCYEVVAMMNVGGTLHIIKQSAAGANMLIWRKVQILTDETELIDQTWFTSPLGVNNTYVGNGYDGICSIGGNILAWAKGQGLAALIDGGMELNCEAIRAGRNSNLNVDAIVAPCDNHRMVLVKPVGYAYSLVYDYMYKRWYRWNIDVTCKGFGEQGGMFGVSNTKAPVKLGDYATNNDDATIIPKVYTPALDLGYPEKEKFLTKIYLQHRDVTSIKIYRRMDPDDAWTLHDTKDTNDFDPIPRTIYLTGECRGGEFYFLIEGSPMMVIKSFGLEFNVGEDIVE